MTEDELQQLKHDVQYIKDRTAILDVINRQSRGHDRHDAALQNSCFWPDGADEHGPWTNPGSAYGEWANETHSAGFTAHLHNITNHLCEIDGDTAHAESYVLGLFRFKHKPGRAQFMSGRYIDRLERRDGEWRIAVRRIVIEVLLEGDSEWGGNPIADAFPRGTWDEDDLSNARPLELATPAPFWDGTTH